MAEIARVEARLFEVPLDEPLVDAKHGTHTHFELVTVEVTATDGQSGTGYTYTGGRGGHAVLAMVQHDLVPFLLGQPVEPVEAIYDQMQWHLHYVARGGIASFAISAVDIALWDLRGKARNETLVAMAGGSDRRCRAYRGGIDLGYPLPKLLASIRGYLDEGFDAVKIKIGQPDFDDDVARIRAVRDLIGPDITFMVDANYAFDRATAIRMAKAFAPHDIHWFEEPIIPDDYAGYREISKATDVPLAMGENLHTEHEFGFAVDQSNLSYLQPDASNCGGITGWLRAADMAGAKEIEVASHGMQELHVSLVSGHRAGSWIEVHSFPIDRYTTRPFRVHDGWGLASDLPGTGVVFDWNRLGPMEAGRSGDMR